MRNLVSLALCLPLIGCVVGDGGTAGDDQGGGGGDGSGCGSGSGSGGGGGASSTSFISSNTTWDGIVSISGNVMIDQGVTVTIAAGAKVTVKGGALITVNGILDAQGASGSKITIAGLNNMGFGGMTVNGELKYKYVDQQNGPISLYAGGKATIVDSQMSRVFGDFLVMNGGTLDMQYSMIGRQPNEADTTHCDMHFGGQGNVIKVTHSNISTSSYGLMFYGGNSADFTYNNWLKNTTNVDTQAASPVSGDFSNGYFEGAAPTGTGITAQNVATARLAACTGANDATCAGPRPYRASGFGLPPRILHSSAPRRMLPPPAGRFIFRRLCALYFSAYVTCSSTFASSGGLGVSR